MVGMMTKVATRGWPPQISGEWTVEQLDSLPEDNLRYELLDGVLLVNPNPNPNPVPRHQGDLDVQAARNRASTAVSASSSRLIPARLIMLVMFPRWSASTHAAR